MNEKKKKKKKKRCLFRHQIPPRNEPTNLARPSQSLHEN